MENNPRNKQTNTHSQTCFNVHTLHSLFLSKLFEVPCMWCENPSISNPKGVLQNWLSLLVLISWLTLLPVSGIPQAPGSPHSSLPTHFLSPTASSSSACPFCILRVYPQPAAFIFFTFHTSPSAWMISRCLI